MGDFNLNLLKYDENPVHDLITLLYSHMFYPTITKPTRVTNTSATLIDQIWHNNLQTYYSSGIIYTTISDHFPIISTFITGKPRNDSTQIKKSKRMVNPQSISSLKLR